MVSMETLSFDSKTWWEAGLGDGEGCLAALFSGRDGAVQVDEASCLCDPSGRGGTGTGAETSFLRKGSNECVACPVSVKQEV